MCHLCWSRPNHTSIMLFLSLPLDYLNYAVVHSAVFWENCFVCFGHSCVICSRMFYIVDFSVSVLVDMAWLLGNKIFHKNKKIKEILKISQKCLLPFLLLSELNGYWSHCCCFSCCVTSSLSFLLWRWVRCSTRDFIWLLLPLQTRRLLSSDFADHFTVTKSLWYAYKNKNKKINQKSCSQFDDKTLSHEHISDILRIYLFSFHILCTKLTP